MEPNGKDASDDDIVIHLNGLVVPPGHWLVLSTPSHLTPEQVERIKRQTPQELRGRVLVVEQMSLATLPPSDGCQIKLPDMADFAEGFSAGSTQDGS